MDEKSLEGKKIALVIAFNDFKDEEYFTTKKVLEDLGTYVITVSNKLGVALGSEGGEVRVDVSLGDFNPLQFDAVLFIGGQGCLKHLDNDISYKIVDKTVRLGKVLGGICVAPVVLAKGGALIGKKATVWVGFLDKSSLKVFKEEGVDYKEDPVVIDGLIVTAQGTAPVQFAKAIASLLTS